MFVVECNISMTFHFIREEIKITAQTIFPLRSLQAILPLLSIARISNTPSWFTPDIMTWKYKKDTCIAIAQMYIISSYQYQNPLEWLASNNWWSFQLFSWHLHFNSRFILNSSHLYKLHRSNKYQQKIGLQFKRQNKHFTKRFCTKLEVSSLHGAQHVLIID